MKIAQIILAALLLTTSCGLIPHQPPHSITFRGHAEVKTTPDTAIFTITIREEDKDSATAQQKMTEKTNAALDLLRAKGVEKKDIQTENYRTNPKYSYQPASCQKGICQSSKQILIGFEASQTLSLKLHDVSKAGETLSELAALKISEINGPNFTIENPEKFKSEAQALAINNAKEQAASTAKNLGVTLKKIVDFSEDGGPIQPRMMMARGASFGAEKMSMMSAPQLEAGEERIISSVSITYEIE